MNLDGYFRSITQDFTEGRLAKASATLRLPMPLYLNGGILVIYQHSEIIWILARYRRNLQRAGLARSEIEVLKRDADGSDRMRAVVRWSNLTGGGRIISAPTIAYFFSRTASDGWRVAVIDVLSKPDPELIKGTGLEAIGTKNA